MKEKREEVLKMYVNEKLTYKEIAKRANISESKTRGFINGFTLEEMKDALGTQGSCKPKTKIFYLGADENNYTVEKLSTSEKMIYDNLDNEQSA